jgi:hypothetical protein
MTHEDQPGAGESGPGARAVRRWGPLIVLLTLMALVFGMGWHKLLSLWTIVLNY